MEFAKFIFKYFDKMLPDSFDSYFIKLDSIYSHNTCQKVQLIFFPIVPDIGVARIFDWGGVKPQITCNDDIRNFQKRNFLWGKDIAEWKI